MESTVNNNIESTRAYSDKIVNLESSTLSEENINNFLNFLKDKDVYLDTGYGAFHTDNHSNW